LDEWHALLADDPAKARGLLDLALIDRIRFTPNPTRRRYELTIPIAFDRLLSAIVPEFQGGLQEMMASPNGIGFSYQPDFNGIWVIRPEGGVDSAQSARG